MDNVTEATATAVAAAITKAGHSRLSVANAISMPQTTFNRKLSGNAQGFTIAELYNIAAVINVPLGSILPKQVLAGKVAA